MTTITKGVKRGCRPSVVMLVIMLLWLVPLAKADSDELHFTLLHTNDEHSALLPFPFVDYHPEERDPTIGGFARLSRLVKDIRAAKNEVNEQVLLVSAGDILGGAPHFWLIPGGEAPEISLMQQIGYDVVTIGNHEFDYGPEILARYYQAAGYPDAMAGTALVASNLAIPEGHPLAECGILDTHIVMLKNGLRIGFFGLLGENAAKLASKMAPVAVQDLIARTAASVKTLQEKEAEVIICLSHAGWDEDQAVAAAVPGIDVIVAGHYHQMPADEPRQVGETLIVQSSAYVQHLGALELAYSRKDRALRVRNRDNGQPFLLPIDDAIEADLVIADVIAGYTDKLSLLVNHHTEGSVTNVGDAMFYTDFTLTAGPAGQESVLGNFVADAMRLTAEKKTGEKVDFAIQANGVIRSDVQQGAMPHVLNQVTFYDLARSIGLGMGYDDVPGYPLASIYLTGAEIYRTLELALLLSEYGDVFFLQISGGRFTYDPARTVLFQIPFTQWPVPSFRAVQSVEQYIGPGLQNDADENYKHIQRDDDDLYHVVCDYYILSFFPRVAQMLPFYKVVPKDRDGHAIALRDAVIHREGVELKFWQAVVDYALLQPPGLAGIPQAPEYYAHTGARIMQTATPNPRALWPVVALAFVL